MSFLARLLTHIFDIYAFSPEIGKFAAISSDITEHKRMEEELMLSVKQYQTLGDTIPYGVWLTDATGYCIYTSPSFLELVDMSMEQVQKFGWLHLLPPEDVQPTIDHWLHCIQTGENFEREHRFRTKLGNYQNVLAIGRPIKNDKGKITGWVGLNLDITERKQAEEELRQSEDQFRTLIKNVNSGVALVDEDGRFTVVNPSFMQIFGLDNGLDILNVNSQDWSQWEVYGEDGKLLHVDDHPVRKAAKTGKPCERPDRCLT